MYVTVTVLVRPSPPSVEFSLQAPTQISFPRLFQGLYMCPGLLDEVLSTGDWSMASSPLKFTGNSHGV